MSFQAYLDTIQAKTGLDAQALKTAADVAGLSEGGVLKPGVKAGEVVAWGRASWAWATGTPWRSTPCCRENGDRGTEP